MPRSSHGPPYSGGPRVFGSPFLGIGSSAYQLSLPGFQGPIELLLQLAEHEKYDITSVSVVEVASRFLNDLRAQDRTDAVALADFVFLTARLLLLKSRSLLPRTHSAAEADEGTSDLPGRIEAFGAYREAMETLQARIGDDQRTFPRIVPDTPIQQPPLRKIPVDRLAALLQEALNRLPERTVALPIEIVSVRAKIEHILAVLRDAHSTSFLRLAGSCASRVEVVVCFLAILHMIHDGALEAAQTETFGDITLSRKT